MGRIIGCRCDCCSYTTKVSIGGLRNSPREDLTYPVFCKGCYAITTSRYYPDPLKCLDCGSEEAVAIDDPTIWTGDGDAVDCQWSGFERSTTGRTLVQVGKKKVQAWWRIGHWVLGKLKSPDAHVEGIRDEGPDQVSHMLSNSHYSCPRYGEHQLRFPSDLSPMMLFD
jgi:hypothetical protein